jgi:hypothetical protein
LARVAIHRHILAAHLLTGLTFIAIAAGGIASALPTWLHVSLKTSTGRVALHERIVLTAELTGRTDSSGAHAKKRVAQAFGITLLLRGITRTVVRAHL